MRGEYDDELEWPFESGDITFRFKGGRIRVIAHTQHPSISTQILIVRTAFVSQPKKQR